MAANAWNVFLKDRDGTLSAKELATAVRSLGLYATDEELQELAKGLRRPEFCDWIDSKTKEVMDEGMTQRVIDGLSEDIADPEWNDLQIEFLKGRKQNLQVLQEVLQERDQLRESLREAEQKDKHTNVPATSVKPVLARTVYRRLSAAWMEEYVGTKVPDYLLKSLDGYVKDWNENSAYATPWTCIIQSSGWGKSRSVCELSSKGVYVIYMSFSERGIPHGTPGAKVYFTGVQNSVRKIAVALVECLYHLANEMEKGNQSAEQLIVKQTSQNDNLWRAHDWGRGGTEVSELPECQYMDVTLDEWNDEDLKRWMARKMKDLEERFSGRVRDTGLSVLFCLDEAGELFQEQPNLFMVMRRAFSCFPRKGRIFAVLMDTSAKLRMLAPTRMSNPSSRGRLPETKVFAPLCIAGVTHFNSSDLKSKKCGICDFNDTARVLFSIGRPLWAACLLDKDAVPLEDVITYATQKLLGGTSLTDVSKKKTLDEGMAIGILSASIGIEVVAWSELAQTLVASHMRTAVAVSDERDRIFTADVVEPIIGEAAARLLVNNSLLLKVLDKLEEVCKQALVLEGPRGELIGRIILILAMYDCLQQGGNYSQPVPLQRFLTKVCGKEVKCAKGNVFFNRCCVVSGDLTQTVLLQCYLGCFAIIPRRNQEGFDFLIPVLYARSDGEFELSAANMGAIPCQFRDRDSYVVNSAHLVSWAKHFGFSGYKIDARKRQRLEGNFDDDDSEILQQLQEINQFQMKHGTGYVNLLMEEPIMDDTYEDSLMELQNQAEAGMKKYSSENKGRRKDQAKKIDDELKEKEEAEAGEENCIDLSKAIGLYFHLNSPTKSRNKWVMQIEECVILHGLHIYSFLNKDVVTRLEGLRRAYHKLENMVKSKDELDCLKRMVWPYFGHHDLVDR